jgi:hypothetical protein
LRAACTTYPDPVSKKQNKKQQYKPPTKQILVKSSKKIQEELYSMAKWDLFQE